MSSVPEATATLIIAPSAVPWPILYYRSKLQATERSRRKPECDTLQHEESLINVEVFNLIPSCKLYAITKQVDLK